MVFNGDFRDRFGFVLFLIVFAFFFTFIGFASASTPGNISSCQELDTAGNYYLNMSLINENVSYTGCFRISTSNVVLDCQNYYILNTTLNQIGIEAYDSVNVTIQNCNVTMSSTRGYGFVFTRVNNSRILNSISNYNQFGIYLPSSFNNTLSGITSSFNIYGIRFFSSLDNQIINSITSNNTQYGINLLESSNNTLTGITANSNSDSGIYLSSSSDNNQIINSNVSSNQNEGIYIFSSSNNQVINTTVDSDTNIGVEISLNSNNNILSGIIANFNNYGIYLSSSSNNTFLNNLISSSGRNNILDDSTGSNYFIYNNSFGEIRWTSSIFLTNLTTTGNLTFPGNLIIGNNSVYLNSSAFARENINSSANITLYGIPTNMANYKILKDGVQCTDCYNFTSLSAGTVVFNVSSLSNYTINYTTSQTITNPSSSSSSSSGGGGGGGGGASATTYSLNDNDFTNGITKDLQLNDKFKINITENHYVQLVSLGLNLVGINVSSKTQQATLSVGETRDFDVNEDGKYEISISLEKIGILEGVIKNATISVKKYAGEVNTLVANSGVVVSNFSANKEVKKEVIVDDKAQNNNNIIWILFAGIIILIVIYFVWKKKNRGLIGKVHVKHGRSIVVK